MAQLDFLQIWVQITIIGLGSEKCNIHHITYNMMGRVQRHFKGKENTVY